MMYIILHGKFKIFNQKIYKREGKTVIMQKLTLFYLFFVFTLHIYLPLGLHLKMCHYEYFQNT